MYILFLAMWLGFSQILLAIVMTCNGQTLILIELEFPSAANGNTCTITYLLS